MPIDQATFYERLAAILGAEDATPDQDGQWQTPMAALNTASRPYGEVYGLSGDLLDQVAEAARARGDTGLAQAATDLAVALREGTLDLGDAERDERMTRFVYTVV